MKCTHEIRSGACVTVVTRSRLGCPFCERDALLALLARSRDVIVAAFARKRSKAWGGTADTLLDAIDAVLAAAPKETP